jgi:Ca-activated chloride channel family protein
MTGSMKRVGLLVLFGLLTSCSKSTPSRPLLPPWEVLVTGVRPGSFAAPPALVVCEANGSACSPVKPGLRLSGNKLVRTERGVSEFQLDAVTRVEIAEGSELLLEDAGGRSIELRSGGISLTRNAPANTGSLLLRMVDRTVELVGRAAIVAQLDNINRGQLFATQGVVNVAEPAGSAVPVRQFHPGEGAVFERKAPPDLHAVFAGAVSRFRQSVLAVSETPPPPPEVVVQPRGLGTMTARVPGTTAVIAGVRLAQHRVRAVVRDGVAQTEVEEVFRNDTDRVLEGRYVFPLPADATISGLTLFVGDKPVDGEVVEKKRAAAIFKGIVDDTVRPRDPALLEWVRGSEFSLKIFPIPAKGSRTVVLRYQQVLKADGPRQVYVYPLSLGAERRTPIDELSIDVELSDGGQAVQGVVASGYPAKLQPGTSSSHVSLRASGSSPDHDFAVSFKRPVPAATVATAEQGFVAIRMRAELPPDMPAPLFQRRDRVLVVDASHSQSSESFAAARELALGIVRSLEPDERFALLLCDSACEAVPPSGLSPATGKALDDAQALLKNRKPSGASDIAGALLAAAERVPAGAPLQIVYVGDGAASAGELSVPSIARRVRPRFEQRKVDLRLLGAGASVDEVTLTGLARELSGSYDPVLSAGALSEQVEILSASLRSPLLVAPSIEVSSLSELQPRTLPNLRLGQEFVVVGKAAGNAPINVTLRGTLERIPYVLARPVAAKVSAGALPFAARLWAESRIRDLQTSGSDGARKEVIELSQRFRVMSRETSWLVLENEQMFAEFGIPRSKPSDASGALSEAPEARAALAQELDNLDLGALGSTSGSGASSEAAGEPAKKKEAADRAPSAPAKPASPAAEAPSPVAPSAPGGNIGGGLGSSGSKANGPDGLGSGSGSGIGSGSSGQVQVQGPRSNVIVGTPSMANGTITNAARVMAGLRAGFRACHQRSLNENPEVSGSGRLSIIVGSGGQVSSASFAPSGNLPANLVACVTQRARTAQFEPPQGGTLATLSVPLQFQIQAGDAGGPIVSRPPGAIVPRPFEPPADVAVSRPGDDGFFSQGEPALDKLRAELSASPDSRKRHEALVRGLLLRGRFAPALVAAERFVELDPDSAVARELLSYAAVATGDVKRAAAAVDAMTEAEPAALKAQGRAARAFEALGDEARACAHWRSVFELAPASDAAIFESLRCRARVMGDRAAALADAKAVPRPGPLLQGLLPLLESGELPAFQKSSGSAGQFEVTLSCDAKQDCPYVIVITPTGTIFSPWTPALGRSSASSFAFSGLLTGTYRVIRIGGSPTVSGKVEVRALNARNNFEFGPGRPRTLVSTQVTLAPSGLGVRRRF